MPYDAREREEEDEVTEKDDRRNGHEADLRDALDQAMNTLCGSVIFAGRNGDCVPDTAVVALETARIVALERWPYGEASRAAVRRCGTDEESIVRWAEEFVEGFYGRR